MRKAFLGAAIYGFVLIVASPSAAAAERIRTSALATVTGSGTAVFPDFTPVAGDTEEITVDARIAADGSVKGRFKVIHRFASGVVSGNVAGEVTCMAVVGNTSLLSGFITNGKLPGVPGVDPIGRRSRSASSTAAPADAVGVDSSFAPFPHPVDDCAPVPPFLEVSTGGSTVLGG